MRLKQFQNAEQDFAVARKVSPDNLDYVHSHALAQINCGKFVDALESLNKAIELGSRHTRILYLKSRTLNAIKKPKQAREVYQQFMETEPSDYVSWTIRGQEKLKKGDHQGALADFKNATKLNPDYLTALNNIAAVYSILEDNGKGYFKGWE